MSALSRFQSSGAKMHKGGPQKQTLGGDESEAPADNMAQHSKQLVDKIAKNEIHVFWGFLSLQKNEIHVF